MTRDGFASSHPSAIQATHAATKTLKPATMVLGDQFDATMQAAITVKIAAMVRRSESMSILALKWWPLAFRDDARRRVQALSKTWSTRFATSSASAFGVSVMNHVAGARHFIEETIMQRHVQAAALACRGDNLVGRAGDEVYRQKELLVAVAEPCKHTPVPRAQPLSLSGDWSSAL